MNFNSNTNNYFLNKFLEYVKMFTFLSECIAKTIKLENLFLLGILSGSHYQLTINHLKDLSKGHHCLRPASRASFVGVHLCCGLKFLIIFEQEALTAFSFGTETYGLCSGFCTRHPRSMSFGSITALS